MDANIVIFIVIVLGVNGALVMWTVVMICWSSIVPGHNEIEQLKHLLFDGHE